MKHRSRRRLVKAESICGHREPRTSSTWFVALDCRKREEACYKGTQDDPVFLARSFGVVCQTCALWASPESPPKLIQDWKTMRRDSTGGVPFSSCDWLKS